MTNTPDNLRYIKTDQWIRVEGDEGVIGITDFAQDQLNDIVYVELPKVGTSFAKGDNFGVVESVKSTNELFMPMGGEIVALNPALEDEPEIVNEDPYDKGWMVRIKLADKSEWDGLMDAAAYTADTEAR